MFSRFRQRRVESTRPNVAGEPARVPAGERIYAVGDIHGGSVTVVHLGDYIDRGPDTRGVVDTLLAPRSGPVQRVFLMGNHDRWLRQWLETGLLQPAWLQSGADATLESYGITDFPPPGDEAAWTALRQRLLRRMPPGHRRFFNQLQLMHRHGDYLFAHAGIRPGVPLRQQQPVDLMFIREPFLSEAGDLGVVVVHGHTVTEEPVVRGNRIGVDTGAWRTGRLTALVLEDDRFDFIATGEAND